MGDGHLDPAILGAIAAGLRPPAGYGPVERRHLGGCPSCAAELAALRRIAAGPAYPAPPERVWSGIVGELARPLPALPEPAGPGAGPGRSRAPLLAGPYLTGAVCLAAGVVLGAGALAAARRFLRPQASPRSPAPGRSPGDRARRPRG
ncbi:hypothetical protein BJP40_19590 [Streptomyces sp. CC53]|uniref:hypothetical protein n=1 Tax=unclassified Streptomyces TaxID=2593676 RepID=UPI0008DD6738|nr:MULTISPECIES: hypothetical protein [unclassified Streptomyces]OII64759.1 hypothetical protein BJP40_19590 [Streptomyces sp. CC53]OII67327.1 hypothetical protein BJP39_25280 [Streptomyces sp. CC77]